MRSNLPYYQDILSQPEAILQAVASFSPDTELIQIFEKIKAGHFKRIILTGMGSSFHALYPLYIRLAVNHLPVQLIETSELIYYFAPPVYSPDILIITVSQSGLSAEIIRLLQMVNQQAPIIAVTNSPGSPLAAQAATTIYTNAGTEHSVSCKTYLATLVSLFLLGEFFQEGKSSRLMKPLNDSAQAVKGYLIKSEEFIEAIKNDLKGITFLHLTGRGPSMSSVGTGALIIKEAAHFPTEGLSSASFRHGPFEIISSKHCVLIFLGSAPTISLNKRLYQDVVSAGGRAFIIGNEPKTAWNNLPLVLPEFLPLVEILPAQLISIALAEMSGLQAGNFQFGSKITTIE